MASKSVKEVAESTGLSEEQVKRKYPFSFGQVQPTKGTLGDALKTVGTFAAESAPFLGEAIGIKRTSDALDEGDYVGAGIEGLATLAGVMPVAGDALAKGIRTLKPKKTVTAYKLFTKGEDGNLYPLFVDADTKIPQGEFISAIIPESVFTAPNGKKYVPSKGTGDKKGTGDNISIPDQATRDMLIEKGFLPKGSKAKTVKAVALRSGFHAGDSPAAPHIGLEYKGQKYRADDQVWAEVEMPADVDWQSVADANASIVKSGPRKGLLNVGEAQITDQLPSGGYYRYKTNPNMQGNWLISGEMKINRVLEPDEVKKLNDEAGTPDLPTLAELKAAKTTDAPAPRMGYDPSNTNSRVFHLTDADYDEINVVGSGTQDIGFHVGTAEQASARGSVPPSVARMETPSVRENYLESAAGERIIPMVLKSDLKPARIVDMSSFAEPKNWLGNLAVAKTDRQRIQFLLGDQADADLLAKAPKVEVDGEFYFMLPDVMRTGMDENLWKDLITESHKAKRAGLDTKASQEDRIAWFNTLKQTANKNGYDSFVYRNEYEGTSEQNLDALVEQIQKANRGEIDPSEVDMNSRYPDSYMLLEPDQVKSIFGGMTEGDPNYMKNKGGLMLQKGGAVPMQKQMELFMDDYQVAEVGMDKPKKMQSGGLLKDGGLEQDGGTEDPVSGNDVPPGSTQEEVRDDIPAQLSEGEFVFPADVVRYIGLEKLMMMRQEAKMGLKMMNEMGQMGNSEEATMPDDLPFGVTDLIIVDGPEDVDNDEPKEYNVGGIVYGNQPAAQNMGLLYQQPQFQAGQTQVGMAAAPIQMAPISRPQQQSVPVYQPPETLPDPAEFVSAPEGSAPQTIVIVNKETGEERTITFIPGVTQIPEGFVRKEDYVPKEVVPQTETTMVETSTVREDDPSDDPETPSGATVSFGGTLNKKTGRVEEAFTANVSFGGTKNIFGVMGGKELPEGATATLTNIQLPRPEGVYASPRDTLTVNLEMDADTYNDLIYREDKKGSITSRTELAELVEDIENRYGRDYLENTDATLDLTQLLADKRERDAEEAATKAAQARERASVRAAQRNADQQAREAELNRIAREREQRAIYGASDDGPGGTAGAGATVGRSREERQAAGISDGGAKTSTPGGFGGTGRGRSDIGMASGGIAGKKKPKAKKMKRGGLASKK